MDDPGDQDNFQSEATPPTIDERNLAMLAHLLGALGFIGPLVIWLVKKDGSAYSAYVEAESRESLNFHLMFLIIYIALVPVTAITCGVAGALYAPAYLVELIFAILAAVEANNAQPYRYPFNIRFIR